MKKNCFLTAVLILIITGCGQPGLKPPVEGAWQMIGLSFISDDTVENYRLPSPDIGRQIKMWSENYWAFVGVWKSDTSDVNLYGGGTYTLNGNNYEETVIYHVEKLYVGKILKSLLEIRNDTLFQSYHPIDSFGTEVEDYTHIEKYVKAE